MKQLDESKFHEVLRRFERWRSISSILGQKPYDAPNFEDGRLYFRSDYAEQVSKWPSAREQGDWGAYIIEPSQSGLYRVIRSLWHERAPKRTESLEAIFSRAEDAGKYVIAKIGVSLRGSVQIKLPLLYEIWDNRSLQPLIDKTSPPDGLLQEIIESMPDANPEMIRAYLEKYTLHAMPEVYAATFPSNSPYMHVLALSFDQLDAELEDGLPETSTP